MRAALATALLGVLLTSGCGDDSGPLEIQGDGGFVAAPVGQGIWMPVRGCLRDGSDDSVDVMVTKVEGTQVESPDDLELGVAWYPDPGDFGTIGAHGPPPDDYLPVSTTEHRGGTLDDCSLGISVFLHGGADQVVSVRGIDVTYEADGHTYTVHAEADLALCPAGTKPASATPGCR